MLVTGVVGFIGAALAQHLLGKGRRVVVLDNINDYYDPRLKRARLEALPGFRFVRLGLADREATRGSSWPSLSGVWCISPCKSGVRRYSLSKPHAYLDSNLGGFLNVLESCRHNPPKHLISASAYRSIRRRMSP